MCISPFDSEDSRREVLQWMVTQDFDTVAALSWQLGQFTHLPGDHPMIPDLCLELVVDSFCG